MATTLLKDSFTDTNGTQLTAHTMDTGAGWTMILGTSYTIQNNQASGGIADFNELVTADAGAGASVVSVQIDWIPSASNLNANFADGVLTRASDSNNYIQAFLDGTGAFKIADTEAGVYTTRATTNIGALTAGNTYTIKASWAGDTLTATVNGGNAISWTSSFNSTVTKHGNITSSDKTAAIVSDNFLVTRSARLLPLLGVGL